MNLSLPTQPKQQRWEEGVIPPPMMGQIPTARSSQGQQKSASKPVRRPIVLADFARQAFVLVVMVIFSFLSYYLVSRFVVTSVVVQGRSMMPTLNDGDRYLLNRLAYHYRDPQRDELVVLHDPGHDDYAVKRLVGMPNDVVQVKNGAVYINGLKRDEPFLTPGTRTFCPKTSEMCLMLGKDSYFVLGDNRNNSEDSRCYGPIHRRHIIGMISR